MVLRTCHDLQVFPLWLHGPPQYSNMLFVLFIHFLNLHPASFCCLTASPRQITMKSNLGLVIALLLACSTPMIILSIFLVKYLAFLRKRMNTNPSRGPYHFRAPSRIFWRTVRGKWIFFNTFFPFQEWALVPYSFYSFRHLLMISPVFSPRKKQKF